MSILHPLSAMAAVLALSALAAAQTPTYVWSPPNTGTVAGGTNNTIPFWGISSTYQQIHDAPTMEQPISIIRGLGFRPAGNRTVKGRTWEMRLVMSQTQMTSINASTDFATNLGTTNTQVVFGTASTFSNFSWPDFTTNGTQPAFVVPFTSPYTYISVTGNLCWEWRHRNATSADIMPMDASDAFSQAGTTLVSTGIGCTPTGKAAPAKATMLPVQTAPSARQRHLEIGLSGAANSANGMMAVSLSSTTAPIGWCAPVITPLLLLPFQTDGSGAFTFKDDLVKLAGTPPFDLFTQFGFADAGLPGGIGLSDVAGYRTPAVPGAHGITRIYATNRTANGSETATTGSPTRGYGLSVAWLK